MDASNMKLALCMPFYAFDCKSYFASALMFTDWPACPRMVFHTHGMMTAAAKMEMTEMALKWGATHLVMPSSDSCWPVDAVKRLIGHDKDVVSGWGSSRFHPFQINVADHVDLETMMFRMVRKDHKREGLERVALYGELQVYKREVFERISHPWFFGPDFIRGRTMMSEDTYFCLQAAKVGVEIWVDWDIPVIHGADGLVTENGELRSYLNSKPPNS